MSGLRWGRGRVRDQGQGSSVMRRACSSRWVRVRARARARVRVRVRVRVRATARARVRIRGNSGDN